MEPVAVLGSLVETPVDDTMFYGGDALRTIEARIRDDARVRNAPPASQKGRLFMPDGKPFGEGFPLAVAIEGGALRPVAIGDDQGRAAPPPRASVPGKFMDFYTDAEDPRTVPELSPIREWPRPPDTSKTWVVPHRSIADLLRGIRAYQESSDDPAYAADKKSIAWDMGGLDAEYVTPGDVRARRRTTPPSAPLWYNAASRTLQGAPEGDPVDGFPSVYAGQYDLRATIPRLAARVQEAPRVMLELMGDRDDLLLAAAYVAGDVEDASSDDEASSHGDDIVLQDLTGVAWP